MGILELLNQWKNSQCIIEIHYIHAGDKKVAHGRVYSFDLERQSILFYDEDNKSVENISLTQIEDALAAETMKAEASPARQDRKGNERHERPGNQADEPKPPQAESAGDRLHDLREEIVRLIELLPSSDLNALYPLIQHLAERHVKNETPAK